MEVRFIRLWKIPRLVKCALMLFVSDLEDKALFRKFSVFPRKIAKSFLDKEEFDVSVKH